MVLKDFIGPNENTHVLWEPSDSHRESPLCKSGVEFEARPTSWFPGWEEMFICSRLNITYSLLYILYSYIQQLYYIALHVLLKTPLYLQAQCCSFGFSPAGEVLGKLGWKALSMLNYAEFRFWGLGVYCLGFLVVSTLEEVMKRAV